MAYQQVPSIQKGMLSIGDTLPHFRKQAVVSSEKGPKIIELTHTYSTEQDKWLIFFWWPKDFTFICPTEIISFQKNMDEFSQRNTLVLGASTDSEYVHAAWCQNHPGLTNLSFPILADTSKSLAEAMGILENEEKVAYRATFIIDPSGYIQCHSLYPMNVGRNINEILRVLDALQTEELTACDWNQDEQTLTAKLKEENEG